MNGLESNLKTDIGVTTRLSVLYLFVYELADAFGADKNTLDSIHKGVYEEKILYKINFNYYNENNRIVGKVTIEIDWDKHQLFAKSNDGNSFNLDSSKNVHDQISNISDTIIKYVDDLRSSKNVVRVSTNYEYIPEIVCDYEKNAKAMKFLGHCYRKRDESDKDWALAQNLTWCVDKLSEVTISVSNK